MRKVKAFLITILLTVNLLGQNFTEWAPTPPMGWNSWDCYGPTVVESEVKANAAYMSEYLKDFGWEYIVIDIRWYIDNDKAHGYNETDPKFVMDEYGRFMPSLVRFPSAADGNGFKPIADFIHGIGLKFGIHIMRGIPKEAVRKNTAVLGTSVRAADIYNSDRLCNWLKDMYSVDYTKEGAQEYYNSIFDLYASWGIDFVKIDDLSAPYHKEEIEMIRKAIDRTGRKIVLSTSPGETPLSDAEHIKSHANMWRIVNDFWDNWAQLKYLFEVCERWTPYIGSGHFPDGDMLPLGRIGIRAENGDDRMTRFTKDEQYTLMSLFAIFRSPLMFGGVLPGMDPFTFSLLTNKEVLDVLKYSTNNRQLFRSNDLIGWTANDPKTGDNYLALFNACDQVPIMENKALWKSNLVTYKPGEQLSEVNVDISKSRKLFLVVSDGGNGNGWDHADWIEPTLSGPKGNLSLTDLKWVKASSGWANPMINKSVAGNPLNVDAKEYAIGIGTHPNSIIEYDIPEGFNRFFSKVGLDKECIDHPEGATVNFFVFTEEPGGPMPADSVKITVNLKKLGLNGKVLIKDLWTGKTIGDFTDEFAPYIRSHGAGLYRVSQK